MDRTKFARAAILYARMEEPNQSPSEIYFSDPLRAITRKERGVLLGASTLGIAVVKTGLVPSKISTLGIEFEQADKRALLILVGTIVLYFSIAFTLYSVHDYLAWVYRKRLVHDRLMSRKSNMPLPTI